MKAHTPTPDQRIAHARLLRPTQRAQPQTDPEAREALRSEVEADISQFLAAGHTITLVPIGASAFDPRRQRNSRFFLTEWDE